MLKLENFKNKDDEKRTDDEPPCLPDLVPGTRNPHRQKKRRRSLGRGSYLFQRRRH